MSASDRIARQRVIREIIARAPIGSQGALAEALAGRGFSVTQATVSRDIAELGLVKVPRSDGHVYIAPEDLAAAPRLGADERLQRVLADVPVTVGRSALTLVLTGSAGTASIVAQAIDESTLRDQIGTLAGDNTVLVLFGDEPALLRWLDRFETLRQAARSPALAPTEAIRP
jgi:transcriptional regulator of arginine metabolism